jgi:hypothetical protein
MSDDDDWHFRRTVLSRDSQGELKESYLASLGIGERHMAVSLAGIPDNLPYKPQLAAIIGRLHIDDDRSLLIHSPKNKNGVGKTGAAVLWMKAARERGASHAFFYRPTSLADEFTTYSPRKVEGAFGKRRLTDILRLTPFLVFDNIAECHITGRDGLWFEDIIRSRYDRHVATCITTTLAPDAIVAAQPWFRGVLYEQYDVVFIDGTYDYRDAAAERRAIRLARRELRLAQKSGESVPNAETPGIDCESA